MGQIMAIGQQQFSFSGSVVAQMDDADSTALGYVYDMNSEYCEFNYGDNNAYPITIDSAQYAVNKTLGLVVGTLNLRGYLKNDHFCTPVVAGALSTPITTNGADFLTNAFGPRISSGASINNLNPWIVSLKPYNGATAIPMSGVFWTRMRLQAMMDVSGERLVWGYTLSGIVIDPLNQLGAVDPGLPGVAGTFGTGESTFGNSKLTNGAASSPTTYDKIRRIALDISNGGMVTPATNPNYERMADGYTPGPVTGALALTQLGVPTNAVPQSTASALAPFAINIPDGNGSNTFLIALSTSWDARGRQASTNDFWQGAIQYTMFSTNSGNDTNGVWPFVCKYGISPT
ncbi:MAG: hypothetical protein KGL39_27820 [Patescibacteria group bacterium]|nr:hypothetical protein [Patescibacteria group bacterium]